MQHGLILIDIQNDYFAGGAMALVNMESAASNASKLLNAFRDKNAPIIHIRHLMTRPGATFFLPGTEGVEIHSDVRPVENETVVEKNFPNGFRDTNLRNAIDHTGVNSWVFCGAMSHMCVDATVRAAFDVGLECTVIHDACATRNLNFNGDDIPAEQVHASFMAALAVPYAMLQSTDAFLEVA